MAPRTSAPATAIIWLGSSVTAAAELFLDTGPLVAILNSRDLDHARCADALQEFRGVLLTTEPVLTECMHLLARIRGGPAACLTFFDRGGAQLVPQSRDSLARCGELMHRYADVPVTTAWIERVVRVPDLPRNGLDQLRLRFEWLGPTPARVWVDDVVVAGQEPSESGRRAHGVLLEALQAYRAKRYADFARLVGSRRARAVVHDPRLEEPDALRTGQAADLPSNLRLR